MNITKVTVENYRCLRKVQVELNKSLNILVGNNECGKSTLLEAIYVALSGQLNGRPVQTELHPYLFNSSVVAEYIKALATSRSTPPPAIVIELYFEEDTSLVKLKGINNSTRSDCPGVKLSIEFNQDYAEELQSYIANPSRIRTLPVEYYQVRWRSFAGNEITARSIPIKPSFIDASTIRNNTAASRYITDIIRDSLTKGQKVDLALSYRMMKDAFLADPKVMSVNQTLAEKKGDISDKELSVSLDTSSRAGWETGVLPHLDNIPLGLTGKGEQNSIKIKLSLESAADSQVVLIEEPENHLSFANLNRLINHISERNAGHQLIITTHSSFVLNKLGIESLILFQREVAVKLTALSNETQDYFMRLPGHDTLRLALASQAILVEGPSDELIVQAAYKNRHKKLPLEAGIDVIAVGSLAFKRFLEIAVLLGRSAVVVTDNDGSIARLEKKYASYLDKPGIKILFDDDEAYPTLEPQLLKANDQIKVEQIINRTFATQEELLNHMEKNKTDVALKFFRTDLPWNVPLYIQDAIG